MKKDILKKRLVLEKELQNEIKKELATELASRAKQDTPAVVTPAKQEETKPKTPTASPTKKRYEKIMINSSKTILKLINSFINRTSGVSASKQSIEVKVAKPTTSSGESSRKSAGARRKPGKPGKPGKPTKSPGGSKKKEKLYCTCQTPYDDSK